MRKPRALATQVLVRLKKIEREQKSAGGIIMKINDEFDQQCMAEGYVVDIGPYAAYRRGVPFRDLQYKIGDCVMFYKHAGTLMPDGCYDSNYHYRVIDDLDITCVFEGERIEL